MDWVRIFIYSRTALSGSVFFRPAQVSVFIEATFRYQKWKCTDRGYNAALVLYPLDPFTFCGNRSVGTTFGFPPSKLDWTTIPVQGWAGRQWEISDSQPVFMLTPGDYRPPTLRICCQFERNHYAFELCGRFSDLYISFFGFFQAR